jgi:hypothetical protein
VGDLHGRFFFLFFSQPGFNRLFELLQDRILIWPFGHNPDRFAPFHPQQRNKAFAVGHLAVGTDADVGLELFGQINKIGGRAGVQAVAALYASVTIF